MKEFSKYNSLAMVRKRMRESADSTSSNEPLAQLQKRLRDEPSHGVTPAELPLPSSSSVESEVGYSTKRVRESSSGEKNEEKRRRLNLIKEDKDSNTKVKDLLQLVASML